MSAGYRRNLGLILHHSFMEQKCSIWWTLVPENCSKTQPECCEQNLMFTHWGRDILFLRFRLTLNQHWFRQWLGAVQATSHYLNQCCRNVSQYICVTRPQWVKRSLSADSIILTWLDNKVHGAQLGPTWGRQDPGGPHMGHMNLAILDGFCLGDRYSSARLEAMLENCC